MTFKLLFALGVHFLVLFYAGAATNRANQSHILSEARALLLQGKRQEAMTLLRNSGSADLVHKSSIIGQQFVTTDNFQKYQEMVAYHYAALWTDCIKTYSEITLEDQTNLLLMNLYASCLLKNDQLGDAMRIYHEVLKLNPKDPEALIGLATISMIKKDYKQAEKLLEPLLKNTPKIYDEMLVLLRSEIKTNSGDLSGAIDLLQKDLERNVDHLEVAFRLGDYFQKKKEDNWQARKAFMLFMSRYKKSRKNADKNNSAANTTTVFFRESKKLEELFLEAQARLAMLEKKLELTEDASGHQRP